NGLDKAAAVERVPLKLGRDVLRERGCGGGDRSSETLQRKLPVKQLRIGGGTLEVAVRVLEPPSVERGSACPIIALGLDLERLTTLRIAVEHRDCAHRTMHAVQRDAPGQPGKGRIIVADGDWLVRNFRARR